jgi:hypothetical protein
MCEKYRSIYHLRSKLPSHRTDGDRPSIMLPNHANLKVGLVKNHTATSPPFGRRTHLQKAQRDVRAGLKQYEEVNGYMMPQTAHHTIAKADPLYW